MASKLPQEVRQLYSDLDELRQRHPVHPVRKEELEGALVDDSKIPKQNKRVRKYYEKQNSYVKELLDVRILERYSIQITFHAEHERFGTGTFMD